MFNIVCCNEKAIKRMFFLRYLVNVLLLIILANEEITPLQFKLIQVKLIMVTALVSRSDDFGMIFEELNYFLLIICPFNKHFYFKKR